MKKYNTRGVYSKQVVDEEIELMQDIKGFERLLIMCSESCQLAFMNQITKEKLRLEKLRKLKGVTLKGE